MEQRKDYDILEMPPEGLAAYWLSIKKLIDVKKSRKVIDDEISYTKEPFIKHLLETSFGRMDEDAVRRLARAKRGAIMADYRRKFNILRLALQAIAAGENPRLTYVRMISHFAVPPIREKTAFDMVQAIADGLADKSSDQATLLDVDHKMKPDRLLVKLLFYVSHARREGKQSLAPFLRDLSCPFFAEGLSLVIDGLESDLVAHFLHNLSEETLAETRRKMSMAEDMCLAIKAKTPYDDLFAIARAYMP